MRKEKREKSQRQMVNDKERGGIKNRPRRREIHRTCEQRERKRERERGGEVASKI